MDMPITGEAPGRRAPVQQLFGGATVTRQLERVRSSKLLLVVGTQCRLAEHCRVGTRLPHLGRKDG